MGFFTRETKSFYIARPPEFSRDLIYLHPDKSIPRGAKLTVRSDECALFFREGKYIGTINPGTTTLIDTANIPFLGHLLIDNFTGGDHFITEVFFVLLSEVIVELPPTPLGQYQDINSKNVVSVNGKLQYSLRVQEPLKLITEVGGQSAVSQQAILQILNGRLLNGMRKLVAQKATMFPILSITSNIDSEEFSNELINFLSGEFDRTGTKLMRMFDLSLDLDGQSLELLREFGKQESNLAIQSKGAQIANQQGFTEFNMVQGQRAALEGLGQGLSQGNGVTMLGMGLGANLTGVRSSGNGISRSPRTSTRSSTLAAPRSFFMSAGNGETGPYTARQLALMAISANQPLANVMIRGDDDPVGSYFPAHAEPLIATEYERRFTATTTSSSSSSTNSRSATSNTAPQASTTASSPALAAFDAAFNAAIQDGHIQLDETKMLTALLVTLNIEPSEQKAKAHILRKADELNIQVEL
jgi:membrane protease subunit (stomatin/prohibitin family)